MKKLLSVVMAMVLFLGMLAGCAFGGANSCYILTVTGGDPKS